MEEVQGVPVTDAPEGPERAAAARQLLESFYKQIAVDGFFHADPHPGNLMWWKDKIYFLDLGMVGVLDGDLREQLMLLLMAFWQEDAQFLTDVTFMLSGDFDSSRLEPQRYQAEIGALMAKYRKAGLAEMQIGPIMQEMSAIALSHGVPLPASLTLVGKALAQVQLATAQLDPTIDPFDVAGKFLQRAMLKAAREKFNAKTMLYEGQKLTVRVTRFFETVEKLIGAEARAESRGEVSRPFARGRPAPHRPAAHHRPHRDRERCSPRASRTARRIAGRRSPSGPSGES